MSNSLAADEDWSIISSSSDFEDECTAGSSVRDSGESGNATPPDSEIANDDIDQSTCTIQGDASTETLTLNTESNVTILDEELLANESSPADNTELKVESNPGKSTKASCGVVQAATAMAAFIYGIDQYLRSVSRKLFRAAFSVPLNSLRGKVATSGTVNISLLHHAVYSLLVELEQREDFLLYYLAGLLAAAASMLCLRPSSVTKSTYSSRFHQMWINSMYEPQEKGFTSYFHAHKPKQLKLARYIDVVSKQAHGLWFSTKASTVSICNVLKQDPRRFLRVLEGNIHSSLRHAYQDVNIWLTNASPKAMKNFAECTAISARELFSKYDHKKISALLKKGSVNVSHWVLTTLKAATNAYRQNVLAYADLVASRTARWAETCKAVSGNLVNRMLAFTKEVQHTEIEPLAQFTKNHGKSLYLKFKVDSQTAAIHANRMFTKWSNSSLVYGHMAWNSLKKWSLEALSDCRMNR